MFCGSQHLAVMTGLEPAISNVTGWDSNQLNYITIVWWSALDSIPERLVKRSHYEGLRLFIS